MAEKPQQHAGKTNPQDQDLEAQLDALLNDLEAADPQAVPADLRKTVPSPPESPPSPEPEPAPEAEAPEPEPVTANQADTSEAPPQDPDAIESTAASLLDQQIDATLNAAPEPGPVPAAKPVALGEAELGAQIDALLSNVKAQSAQAVSSPAPEPGPAPIEPEPAAVQEASGEARIAEDTAEPAEPEPSDAGAVSIEQIDAMLAESAEQALAEAQDDPSQVPGTDEILAAQAQAEAVEAEAKAQAQAEAQALEQASPEPQPAAAEPKPAPVGGATAQDVARELDEEPQAVPAASATPAREPAGAHSEHGAGAPSAAVIHQSALKKTEQALRRICGKVNRPLCRMSPEMRDTIGWVGVVTLGLGFAIFIYGLLF